MSKTAIVILNYNGKDYLEKFLSTVIECSPEAAIIVADNHSSDDSIPFLRKSFPDIPLIELEKNHGYAGGYNQALKQVEADYYVLLNSDVEPTKNWLAPIVEFLDANPGYACAQPKIRDYHNRERFEYAGAAGGYVDKFGYPFCRGRVFETVEVDQGQYDNEVNIFWASGACMVVRSSVFKDVGGLDKDFFAHMEEIDLCWRILNSGHRIRFIPTSVVYHVGGGTLARSSPFKTYLNFRNGLLLILKNMPSHLLIWKFPTRLILDWVAMIKFLLSLSPRHSLAVLKAHFAVVPRFIKTIQKREKVRGDLSKIYSVVYKYFVLGRKKYSDF